MGMSHNSFAIDLSVTAGVVIGTAIQGFLLLCLMKIPGCYFERSEGYALFGWHFSAYRI